MTNVKTFNNGNLNQNKKSAEFFLFAIFLFFLPFSQALTIQLFFPLKISEVALFLYILVSVLKQESVKLPKSRFFLLIYLFLALVFLSIIINALTDYNYPLTTSFVRISPMGDSLFKFAYLILAIWCLSVSYKQLSKNIGLLKYFFWGAVAACSYCWYLFFSGLMHIPVIKLPGMEQDPPWMPLSFATIIRCGTAKEGNFMAFFLFITGIIAMHFNKKKLGIFFFATILTTFSTVAVVCAAVYFVLLAVYNKNVSKAKIILLIVSIVVSVAVAGAASSDFKSLVINKLFGTEETVGNTNDILSRVDRLNSAEVGMDVFENNLFWGVGMSNYSLHYDHFNQLPSFAQIFKRIPNNIYIEILSESGIFATIIFASIFIVAYRSLNGNEMVHLKVGLIIMLIYFMAFPTYTMLFIWVYLAIVMMEKNIQTELRPASF